jgi:predicted 2-oxoglutarate/Fe(II)-dependent dioxygenase YbiX
MHRHSERVFTIQNFLSQAECEELIALAEAHGFEAASVRTQSGPQLMANVRNNQRVMFNEPVWKERLWSRLASENLPVLDDNAEAVGLPADLRFYKYNTGERFKMHKDGPWTEGGLTSKLSFLVYLNHAFTGGRTDFREFVIQPVVGTALLFVHDTWHEGEKVVSGTKYVLRSDVLYAARG